MRVPPELLSEPPPPVIPREMAVAFALELLTSRIDAREREAARLYYLEAQADLAQVAVRLGVRRSVVSGLLARFRARLKRMLRLRLAAAHAGSRPPVANSPRSSALDAATDDALAALAPAPVIDAKRAARIFDRIERELDDELLKK